MARRFKMSKGRRIRAAKRIKRSVRRGRVGTKRRIGRKGRKRVRGMKRRAKVAGRKISVGIKRRVGRKARKAVKGFARKGRSVASRAKKIALSNAVRLRNKVGQFASFGAKKSLNRKRLTGGK